jgi:hypothetical protein
MEKGNGNTAEVFLTYPLYLDSLLEAVGIDVVGLASSQIVQFL